MGGSYCLVGGSYCLVGGSYGVVGGSYCLVGGSYSLMGGRSYIPYNTQSHKYKTSLIRSNNSTVALM